MRTLQKSLRGEPITRIMGIVNGTTNYMLSAMTEDGADYAEILAEAQRLGYAEADPTADVEGHDAQAKAAIIATVAFGVSITADDVPVEGISGVTAADIANASRLGYVIKLLAVVERVGTEAPYEISARVNPTMVPFNHPLATVRGSFNAVFIEGGALDELMLYGRGAGGRPTASAVLGDVIEAASGITQGTVRRLPPLADALVRPPEAATSAFYLDLAVDDSPGVLAEVAGVFGANHVSIRSMEQEGTGTEASLAFITHQASEADIAATIEKLNSLPSVNRVGALYRVIGV
jgi:homoserine dehydrogenase